MSCKTFKRLYQKYIQDSMYKLLSESTRFCVRYDKNLLVFFRITVYMSQSWNVNTRAKPKCWHFNWGTYISACHTSLSKPKCWHFNWGRYISACHTSLSCIMCFVASLTKLWLNSIKNLHFTGMEWYIYMSRHNNITSRVWSHAHCSTSANEHVPDLFTVTCRNCRNVSL